MINHQRLTAKYIFLTLVLTFLWRLKFSSATGSCPQGWTANQNSCYKYVTDFKLTWQQSENYCLGYGAHLVSVLNDDENWYVQGLHGGEVVWVGLKQKNDSASDELSNYDWTDGSNWDHYWNFFIETGGPDSEKGLWKCVHANDHTWLSKDCSVVFNFICKMPAGPENSTAGFTTVYPPTQPTKVPCNPETPEDGWIKNPNDPDQKFCYYIEENYENATTWSGSSQRCLDIGGWLTSIHTIEENEFLVTAMNHGRAWIGFNSRFDGHWRWIDGSDVGYQRWSPGEPNSADMRGEDCVELSGETAAWNDINCNTQNSFICKKPASGDWTTPPPTKAPVGYCPTADFQEYNGHCYRLMPDPMAWLDAKTSCKTSFGSGFNLASVHSVKENALLSSMLWQDKKGFKNDYGEVFLGGISTVDGGEEFEWVDYTEFNMDNWARDQPDQMTDNCVSMYENAPPNKLGEWEDHDCATPLAYICKGPVSDQNKKPNQPKCGISDAFEGMAPHRDSCYWESDESKTWQEAEEDCQSKGGHLLSVLDWTEQNYAFATIKSQSAWIGISDVDVDSWRVFWSDGQQMSLTNWAVLSSCAHLNGTDGLWYLADCHEEKNYICKASTDPPVTPKPTKDGFCVKRFEDYLPGSDYCYKMFSNWDEFGANDYNLWSKAELHCMTHGGHLASLHSSEEVMAVMKNWVSSDVTTSWIGRVAERDPLGLGPVWRWSDNTSTTDFEYWQNGYPANLFSVNPQCAYMTSQGTWGNMDCTPAAENEGPVYFLCKAPKVDISPPGPSNSAASMTLLVHPSTDIIIIMMLYIIASSTS